MCTSDVLRRWATTVQGKSLHSAGSTVESGVSEDTNILLIKLYVCMHNMHCLTTIHFPVAMANIARHVIANEYSLADDSVKTVSDSHESTPHPPEDLARTRLEESSREDSPSSTSSGQEPCDSTVVSVCII